MRHQHGLREILGELLISFVDSGPQARRCFPQVLGVELGHMGTGLDRVKKLIDFQLSQGNAAYQLIESVLSELLVDLAKLHNRSVTQGKDIHRRDAEESKKRCY